ncbi:MAG: hypothetical protein LC667_02665 [Thioalkalivibrio sp.]|nr:hypothetical protein [Thioalkalivibrio sp.]
MKAIPALGAVLALAATVFALRIVLHGYTGHGHLDVFHLVVGLGSAALALVFAWRALAHRNA